MIGRKSVFEELYYGNINESERLLGKIAESEEYKQYQERLDKFTDTLTEKQKKLFDEFSFAAGGYHGLSLKRNYINGVKLGMAFILELVDFDPTFRSDD